MFSKSNLPQQLQMFILDNCKSIQQHLKSCNNCGKYLYSDSTKICDFKRLSWFVKSQSLMLLLDKVYCCHYRKIHLKKSISIKVDLFLLVNLWKNSQTWINNFKQLWKKWLMKICKIRAFFVFVCAVFNNIFLWYNNYNAVNCVSIK